MKKHLSTLVLTMFFALSIFASTNSLQQPANTSKSVIVSGIVSDKVSKETLAGALVIVNGQKVYTDLDGHFSVKICQENCKMRISYISYIDQEIELSTVNSNNLEIALSPR